MPTSRRRRLRGRRTYSREARYQLLTGRDWFHDGKAFGAVRGLHAKFDEETARAAWWELRDELLAYWLQDPEEWSKHHRPDFDVAEPGGPGTRPWAWWRFDAPEPRRQVGGAPVESLEGWRGRWGLPLLRGYYPDPPLFETERDYLERLGLLAEAERQGLEREGGGG